MSKNNTKKQNNQKPKGPKLPEVEDFFTNFLGKKDRNLKKKISHIEDLEKKKKAGEELKKEQLELIERRHELDQQMNENDAIRRIYLEAWLKKDELDPKADKENKKDNQSSVTPVVNEQELINRGVSLATHAVSKCVVVANKLNSRNACRQFSELSNVKFELEELESLHDLTNCLFGEKSNWDKYCDLQKTLENFANKQPVLTEGGKYTYEKMHDLVERVVNTDSFNDFVAKSEMKIETNAQKNVQVNVNAGNVSKQEEHEMMALANQTRSRKESEAQHDMFMADDDSEDDATPLPQEPVKVNKQNNEASKENVRPQGKNENQRKKSENLPKQSQPQEVKPDNKKDVDSDGEEWHTANRGPRQFGDNKRGGNRGHGYRGGRGRGGRGGYNKDFDRERRPRTEGGDGQVEGEKRYKTWIDKDGNEQKREWKPRGEYRGNRGNRGYGRGGKRGGWKKDGEQKEDGERQMNGKQGELKEVGALPQEPKVHAEEN